MKKLQPSLKEETFYHIFNRGNNGERIFYTADNYCFFLNRLDEYLSPFIDIYAFCLLPNHFHLLIRVKEVLHLEDAKLLKDPASKAFHRFFTSYSKAINKQENRHGSLIENPFKRIEINNTQYFANLVFYIHANPQLHGICDDFRHYPWSSYKRIITKKPSKLKKEKILEWFENKENYLDFHSNKIEIETIRNLME